VATEEELARRRALIDPKRVKEASWLTVGICIFVVAFLALSLAPLVYFLLTYKS
jgi:hypothetical protein